MNAATAGTLPGCFVWIIAALLSFALAMPAEILIVRLLNK
jgi:hypothetical protein